MFEGLLERVLLQMFGRYIENFDRNNLHLSIWQGDVVLTDLELKKDSLDELGLPLDLVEGHIRSLSLFVPWTRLGSDSVRVTIDGVSLLCTPSQSNSQKHLQRSLHRHYLAQHAASLETQEQVANYSETLFDKIVNNVQITVKNVHVRYEDSTTIVGKTFACGFTLGSLIVQTTDGEDRAGFATQENGRSFKRVELEDLALYWNSNSPSWIQMSSPHRKSLFARVPRANDDEKIRSKSGFEFILRPLTLKALLVVNPEMDERQSKYSLSLTLPNVDLLFTDQQYKDIVEIFDYLSATKAHLEVAERIASLPEFPRRVAGTLWAPTWRRAIKNVILLKTHRLRISWPAIKRHREDRTAYLSYWQKRRAGSLSEFEARQMQIIEDRLDYDSIVLWRQQAQLNCREQGSTQAKPQGWLGSIGAMVWRQAEPQEAQELKSALGLPSDSSSVIEAKTNQGKDVSHLHVKIQFQKVTFSLLQTADEKKATELANISFAADMAAQLREQSYTVRLNVGSVRVEDRCTDTRFRELVLCPTSKFASFQVDGSKRGKADHSLSSRRAANTQVKIELESTGVVLVPEFVACLANFFYQKGSEHLYAAASAWEKQARNELVVALTVRRVIDLQVVVHRASLLIPLTPNSEGSRFFVASIDRLSLRRWLDPRLPVLDSGSATTTEFFSSGFAFAPVEIPAGHLPVQFCDLYDSILFHLSAFRVEICDGLGAWKDRSETIPVLGGKAGCEMNLLVHTAAKELHKNRKSLRLCKTVVYLELPEVSLVVSQPVLLALDLLQTSFQAAVSPVRASQNLEAKNEVDGPSASSSSSLDASFVSSVASHAVKPAFRLTLAEAQQPQDAHSNPVLDVPMKLEVGFLVGAVSARIDRTKDNSTSIPAQGSLADWSAQMCPMFDFQVQSLRGSYARSKYEVAAGFYLQAFDLLDNVQPHGAHSPYARLAGSIRQADCVDDFIGITAYSIRPLARRYRHELLTRYNLSSPFLLQIDTARSSVPTDDPEISTFVNAEFNSLHIGWNPSTIAMIVDYVSSSGLQASSARSQMPSTTLLQVRMTQLILDFNKELENRGLVQLSVENLSLSCRSSKIVSKDCGRRAIYVTTGKLGDLSVFDSSKVETKYRTLLNSFADDRKTPMVEFSFTKYPEPEMRSNVEAPPATNLQLTISFVQMVYLQPVVWELIDYFNEGILGAITARLQSAVPSLQHHKIQVSLIAPRLWSPRHRQSHQYLSCEMGKLELRNALIETRQQFLIDVNDIEVRPGVLTLDCEPSPFLQDLLRSETIVHFDLRARYLMPPSVRSPDIIDNVIEIESGHVRGAVSWAQMVLMLEIWFENVRSLPPSVTPTARDSRIRYHYADPKAVLTYHVMIRLESAQLDVNHSTRPNDKLAVLTVRNVTYEMKSFLDSTMRTTVTAQNIVCEDARSVSQSSPHRSVLIPFHRLTSSAPDDLQDLIFTREDSSSGVVINLKVVRPAGFLLPSFWAEASQWCFSALAEVWETCDRLPKNPSVVSSENEPNRLVPSRCFHFTLQDAKVILVEDLENPISRALIVACDVKFSFTTKASAEIKSQFDTSWACDITELRSYVSRVGSLAARDEENAVTNPCTLRCAYSTVIQSPHVTIHTKPSNEVPQHSIVAKGELSIEPSKSGEFEMRASMEDFILFSNVVDSLGKYVDSTPSLEASSRPPWSSAEQLPVPPVEGKQSQETQLAQESTLIVRWKELCVVVINDCDGRFVPLFHGRLLAAELQIDSNWRQESAVEPDIMQPDFDDGEVKLELGDEDTPFDGFSRTFSIQSLFGFEAGFFNPKVAAWEPLLEPCQLNVLIQQHPKNRPEGTPGITFFVDCRTPINLNLTHAFLENLLASLNSWAELRAQSPKSRSLQFSPCYLRNETGDDLVFLCQEIQGAVSAPSSYVVHSPRSPISKQAEATQNLSSPETTLAKDTEIPLFANKAQRSIVFAQIPCTLAVRLAGGYVHSAINTSKVGRSVYMVRSRSGNNNEAQNKQLLFVDISLRNGSKLITLRSSLRFLNNTALPLLVLLHDHPTLNAGQIGSMPHLLLGPVLPGNWVHLSPHTMHFRYLSCKPSNPEIDWSDTTTNLHKVRDVVLARRSREDVFDCRAEARLLSCFPVRDSLSNDEEEFKMHESLLPEAALGQVFNYHLQIASLGQQITLRFETPLVIENLFPVTLEYAIMYERLSFVKNEETGMHQGEIESGGLKHIFSLDIRKQPFLVFRLPGFSWSEMIRIANLHLEPPDRGKTSKSRQSAVSSADGLPVTPATVATHRAELRDGEGRALSAIVLSTQLGRWISPQNFSGTITGGPIKLQLYCEFWLSNKALVPLTYGSRPISEPEYLSRTPIRSLPGGVAAPKLPPPRSSCVKSPANTLPHVLDAAVEPDAAPLILYGPLNPEQLCVTTIPLEPRESGKIIAEYHVPVSQFPSTACAGSVLKYWVQKCTPSWSVGFDPTMNADGLLTLFEAQRIVVVERTLTPFSQLAEAKVAAANVVEESVQKTVRNCCANDQQVPQPSPLKPMDQAIEQEAYFGGERLARSKVHSRHNRFDLGVQFVDAPGAFFRTKVVTFFPRFIIVNQLSEALAVRQLRVDPMSRSSREIAQVSVVVDPGKFEPLQMVSCGKLMESEEKQRHWLGAAQLSIANYGWSSCFPIEDEGELSICCRFDPTHGPKESRAPQFRFFRIQAKLQGATFYIVCSEESQENPTYRVENNSERTLFFRQSIMSHKPGTPTGRCEGAVDSDETKWYRLLPGTSIPFAWDDLLTSIPLTLSLIASLPGQTCFPKADHCCVCDEVDIDTQGGPPRRHNASQIELVNMVSGSTKVLVVQPISSLQTPRKKAATQEILEFFFELFVPQVGISVIDPRPQELLFLSLSKTRFMFSLSDVYQKLEMQCGDAQLDCQLNGGVYPVVLSPAPVLSTSERPNPFLRFTVIRVMETSRLLHLEYVGFGIRDCFLRIDQTFAAGFVPFLELLGTIVPNQPQGDLSTHVDSAIRALDGGITQMIYLEELAIQSMICSISFATVPDESFEQMSQLITNRPISALGMSVLVMVSNIENAKVRLSHKQLSHSFTKISSLTQHLLAAYKLQLRSQMYEVMGSSHILGNPVGFYNHITAGITGLVHETTQIKGLGDFGTGVVRGVGSLSKNVICGLASSASSLTGSLGNAFAALSADSNYMAERVSRKATKKQNHVGQGLLESGVLLGKGLFDGVKGVVVSPMEGAWNAGAPGFVKGLGKGVVGLVVKPVTGVLDAANSLTDGIKNSATALDKQSRRVRAPRILYAPNALIKIYDSKEIECHYFLGLDGRFKLENCDQIYKDHLCIPSQDAKSKLAYVLTDMSLICLRLQSSPPQAAVDWCLDWIHLNHSETDHDHMCVTLHTQQSVGRRRSIRCGTPELTSRLSYMVEAALKDFRAKPVR